VIQEENAADARPAVCQAARKARHAALAFALFSIFASPAHSQQSASAASPDLSDKSLEDLMNTQVTSVSKKEQKLSQVAAAIFVITQEDIRRSGASNIPDLLRMVPGLDVAQINSNVWAISARGFNGEFSNKLLVLLDGRPVYSPTISGVFWDTLDVPLEDIARIEVIRGPGGTSWGTNAVNGVINIITKKAGETRGGEVVAGGGNISQGFGTAQYGGGLAAHTDYRVFAKYFNQDHLPSLTGQSGQDGWHALRAGFRSDSELGSKDELRFEGDLYTAREGDVGARFTSFASPVVTDVFAEANESGGYLQSDWTHRYSSGAETALQVSYDQYDRHVALREARQTFNLDFQNHLGWGARQDIVWGVGYRFSALESSGGLTFSLNPGNLNTQLFSGFVQDEISVIPGRVSLTFGTKLEHDYYNGFGVMPSARGVWKLSGEQAVWAAMSRALRTPSDKDTGAVNNVGGFVPPGGPPAVIRIEGNPEFLNEELIAYEAGYRAGISEHVSLDIAAYYNSYDRLLTVEPQASFFEPAPAPPHVVLPLQYGNLMHGETHGIELSASWKVAAHWTLSPGYAFEQVHMHLYPSSEDTQSVAGVEGSSPRNWARLDSHVGLPRGFDWDASATFNDRLSPQGVPAYTRVDTQLSWHARENVTLRAVGQNLANDHHLEFINGPGIGISGLVKRSGYGQIEWRF
jgi:iron complex outermembrane receptor protein